MEAKTQGYGMIGWAVSHMLHGHRVRRTGWNGANMWIGYVPEGASQVPHKLGDGFRVGAHLMIKTSGEELIPWTCSQADLLASDWALVDAPQPGVTKSDVSSELHITYTDVAPLTIKPDKS